MISLTRRLVRVLMVGVVAASTAVTVLLATPAAALPPALTQVRSTSKPMPRGAWAVQPLGGRRYQVSWRSPSRFPVTSDRPTITGTSTTRVGVPTVAADGRTVRAVVTSATKPDPAELQVRLSGARLDVTRTARAARRAGSTEGAVSSVRRLADDPGVPGPYAVVTSDYTRTPVKVAGLEEPVEMIGHVVQPAPDAATGPRPLVLFLHGRHEPCYVPGEDEPDEGWPCRSPSKEVPSHLGYDYVQRLLASQGFTTVSVRVNGINAQDYALEDGGAAARATIVRRHLDYWASIATAHQVDLRRVVLVGHSRGGEGVDRASIQIPLSAPYRIVGQVLIAPTDFALQTAPYVPTVTLLPYCDGDVSDLQGQAYTDVGRDLTTDDTSLKSSVLIMGANHNYFNTEWTPDISAAPSFDDWYGPEKAPCGSQHPGRLSATRQRAVGQAYVAGAARLFAAGQQQLLPLFDGSRVGVASAGKAEVLSHAIGGGRDVRRPVIDASLSLAHGARTRFCAGSTDSDFQPGLCGSEIEDLITPHWVPSYLPAPTRDFLQMAWTDRGQSGGLAFDRNLDLRGRMLDLRTIVDPRLGSVRLRVRLTDAGGATATLIPVGGTRLPALLRGEGVTKLWAQTLRVDPSGATGLDRARIVRVDLIGDSADGRIWVADVSANSGRLAAVPSERLPTLSIGQARVQEGDRTGWSSADVPFRLSGAVDRPAQFVVVTAGEDEGSLRRFTVDIAAGQTAGTIPVGYHADRRDDNVEAQSSLAAWPTRNLMTDAYLGRLTVVDDDPTPEVTVKRVHKTVKEGQSAQWRIRFAAPVDYPAEVVAEVIRGPGRRLTGLDVPRSWLREHGDDRRRSRPLDKLGVSIVDVMSDGSRTLVLSIPVRKDGKREKRESVRVRVDALDQKSVSTVYVAASR